MLQTLTCIPSRPAKAIVLVVWTSRKLIPKCVLLICPIFKRETRQSFVCSDGSEMCTVRIVAMFKWSKSVICELNLITNCDEYPREVKVKPSRFFVSFD